MIQFVTVKRLAVISDQFLVKVKHSFDQGRILTWLQSLLVPSFSGQIRRYFNQLINH
jgi:hypothetical protein